MNNVIPIARPIKETQHISGEAFCFQCHHEWIAIAPSGTVQLECTECKTMKGLFKFPAGIEEGQLVRGCNCGNELFYLTPDGHLCPNCGIYQTYE